MKKLILSLFAFVALMASAQDVSQTFYVDFGENNVSSRGNLTTGRDANGHYWTNVYSEPSERLYPKNWKLVNSANQQTDYILQIGTYFHTNGMSGGGGLQTPSKDLLGDLAIATATQDYMHVETTQDYNLVTFRNLDPSKAYRFNCFGSRVVAEDRGGWFEFHGENYWKEYMQMSGAAIGANGYNGNNNKIMVTDPIFPRQDGTIQMLFVKKYKDGMIYLNCMKIEELSGLERPNQELTMTQKILVDCGETSNDTRGHQTSTDANGNYWNNLASGSSSSNVIATGKTISLRNTERTISGIKLKTLAQFLTNGVNAGGNNNPSVDDLGELAIQTATEDYAFTEDDQTHQIQLQGLNKDRCYRIYIYGCRATSEGDRRFSIFTISGQDDWQTGLATSGQHVGGQNVHGNMRNVMVSPYLFPDQEGNITIGVLRDQAPKSNFAHFNIIKVEEYEGGTRPADAETFSVPVLTGTATENGADIAFNELKPGGMAGGVYECFTRLQPGTFSIRAKNSAGEEVVLGIAESGRLAIDAEPYTVSEEQVVRLRYEQKKGVMTITPVELYLKGNIVADGTKVAYKGDGVFEQEVDMNYGSVFLFSDKYFYFAFNNDEQLAVKRLSGTRTSVAMPSEGFAGDNIRMNRGTYTMTLDMKNYTWNVDAPINPYKITAFGSSVCNGQGATDMKGYAYQYGQQCNTRYQRGRSEYPFEVVGTSIGGNTTQNLLDRYDEMIHDFGKYVIIGLSMGNEGLASSSDKQGVFNRFRDNMLVLINKMKADGKTVVVMNNYTHGQYSTTDYGFIKDINILIHQWDVASVNTLGAIDNGAGKWADNHVADDAHPNHSGHVQFFRAMPPSLFDALENGKPFPVRDQQQSTVLENGSTITFAAETSTQINPYTIHVRIRGTEAGRLMGIYTASGKESVVRVREDGYIEYENYNGMKIESSRAMITNPDQWYDITLTNYYAQRRTILYVNNTKIGEISENVTPKTFFVGDKDQALHREFSELSFWRSAMNEREIQNLHQGKMLKSSLEIYSPLSNAIREAEDGAIENFAQSLNFATFVAGEIPDGIESVCIPESNIAARYFSAAGQQLNGPANGMNIIRREDGTVVKTLR